MWKKIALGVLVVVVGFVTVVATRPSELRVERSSTIDAPPEVVFPMINDLHAWSAWSPWEKLDPGMQRNYEGPNEGTGAIYSWSGNEDVGHGRMTIIESQAPRRVDIKLEFFEPWEAVNTTRFTVEPNGEQSKVTWLMEGENNFAAKAAGLFMDMDTMIGKDFEQGLANMNQAAEAAAKAAAEKEAAAKKQAEEEAKAAEEAAKDMEASATDSPSEEEAEAEE